MKAVNNQVPVTALKFVDENLLLAGVGSFLKLYNWRRGELVAKSQLFPIDCIHGIFINAERSNVIVWGGSSIAIIDDLVSFEGVRVFQCKDRVIDAQLVNGNSQAVVLTAHNEVLEIELDTQVTLKTHKCSERSILYSGKLYLTETKRLVAAGTVFGGVVVWDLATDTITNCFEMHEGSIFDVEWSHDGRYIASCSDDRAIYVSDVVLNKPISEGWGHISRIWKLKFAGTDIISVAEDCSARSWQFSGKELKCNRIMTGHQGRSIWSLDIFQNKGMRIAVTGGGDGKVMLWDLDQSTDNESLEKWSIDKEFGGAVRSCCVADDGTFAVTTTSGSLFLRKMGGEWSLAVADAGSVPLVKSFESIFVVVSNDGVGFSINSDGKLLRTFQAGAKVMDFFILDVESILVVPTPPEINPILVSGDEVRIMQMSLKMGLPTCAVRCSGDTFCVGTRKGDLILFNDTSEVPIGTNSRVLGSKSDAITQIKFVEEANVSYIFATSRSSEYGYFATPSLERLYKTKARKRGSIEGFSLSSQGLLLWGFQKDFFVAWNLTLGCDFISMDCGGSHRSWSLQVLPNKLVFVYVRASELFVHTVNYPSPWFSNPMVQEGTHGREIRGFESCPTNKRLIATGSEDTVLKIGWLNENHCLSYKSIIGDGHVSGIQSLHWSPCGQYLLTGAGQGELVIWRVLAPENNGPIFTSEVGRMPSKRGSEIHELRVMDFSMSENLLAVAFSDSSVRIWSLGNLESKTASITWELLVTFKYRECCLLNINFVFNEWLLITSTDGHLVVYKIEKDFNGVEKKLRVQVHQSGVRSSYLEVDKEKKSVFHLTGGDDNSVHAARLIFNKCLSYEKCLEIKNAHASAVTSISTLPGSDDIVSAGSDEKIRRWARNGTLLESVHTSVTDTGPMIVGDSYIITSGIGVEYFNLS